MPGGKLEGLCHVQALVSCHHNSENPPTSQHQPLHTAGALSNPAQIEVDGLPFPAVGANGGYKLSRFPVLDVHFPLQK